DAVPEGERDHARDGGGNTTENESSRKLAGCDLPEFPRLDADGLLGEIVEECFGERDRPHRRTSPHEAPATANHAANAAIEPRSPPNRSTASVATMQYTASASAPNIIAIDCSRTAWAPFDVSTRMSETIAIDGAAPNNPAKLRGLTASAINENA